MRNVIAALAGGLIMLPACVDVEGGAVELSWVVRADDGRAITDCGCADPAIASVRIALRGAAGDVAGQEPCRDADTCRFACSRRTGATHFDIAPGSYEVRIEPLDETGAALPATGDRGVEVPAPILRDVVKGQVTEVEAFPLIVRCAENCSGMNKSRVCTRQ